MDAKSRIWTLVFAFSVIAFQKSFIMTAALRDETCKVYIVYMGEKMYQDPIITKKSHHQLLSTLLGSNAEARNSLIYSYKHGFSGFAAKLTESQAEQISEFPEVVQVLPNGMRKLHTTRSWEFVGLSDPFSKTISTSGKTLGEGIIIGVMDTGIWPESPSFNDEGMTPIPLHWKGKCQEGEAFNSSNCNKKIIGARWFIKGLTHESKNLTSVTKGREILSARDVIGHGSHTASTAAGNFVKHASQDGLASGLARGGAPRAHLAIYKICWNLDPQGCSDADILKAFDMAIGDGVHIISLSLGYGIPAFDYINDQDPISIGGFHATSKGITVIASAGNSGPLSQTVENTAPWLITVGATTIDRAFPTAIILGNNHTLLGQSIDTGNRSPREVGITYSERIAVNPMDDSAKDCRPGSLNSTLAAGKIILCFGTSPYAQSIGSAAISVAKAGGVGIIYAQYIDNGLTECGKMPCIKVDFDVGSQILSYIRKEKIPVVKLGYPETIIGGSVSPRVATFSSRGPSAICPSVLKPDIVAPGVDILAAVPSSGRKNILSSYALMSGTSMSCPHVSGIVALIKSAHKDWSPAAIRSALITTATQTGTDGGIIIAEGASPKPADPFDIGGGLVNPRKAMKPGLIYDITKDDYIQFLCSMNYTRSSISRLTKTAVNCKRKNQLDLNLATICIPNLKDKVVVTRMVTNVGHANSVYKARVNPPYGINMTVTPRILNFNLTKQVVFTVTFYATHRLQGEYKFGSLTWTDGKHSVRSPIAVRVIKFESYSDV
ncbi:hypothetical protein ACFE04_011748 [Oxalis oulophora]